VISSMMEGGGRKQRGEMNAFGLFAACRKSCYECRKLPPIFSLITSPAASARRDEAFRAGADVFVLGNRVMLQELVLAKINGCRVQKIMSRQVSWCDKSDPKAMASAFDGAGFQLITFCAVEEMIEHVEQNAESLAAVISSSMESGGRDGKGAMNAYDGFARVRQLVENQPCRPVFALISMSATAAEAYAGGADIAITKDNEHREGFSMWDTVTEDLLAVFAAPLPKDYKGLTSGSSFPDYWSTPSAAEFAENVEIPDGPLKTALEDVLTTTFKRGPNGKAFSTRDRTGPQPKNFHLAQAFRIEDSHLWLRYADYQSSLGQCVPFASCCGPGGPPRTAAVRGLPTLNPAVNEAYLFHGTSPEAASGIIHSGFRIDLAGSATSAAFGRGGYFAEASSKSDEYAKCGTDKLSDLYALLLCRVSLGRTIRVEKFYTDDASVRSLFDDDILVHNHYQSLLGDREAVKGTYREFVVFKQEQVYPEFIILYRREF